MEKGDVVEFIDKDGKVKIGVFIRGIKRGRHKDKCIIRIQKNGRERHVKIQCSKLRVICDII